MAGGLGFCGLDWGLPYNWHPDEKIMVPTTFLWAEHDPLFLRAWSDRVGEFFARSDPQIGRFLGEFSQAE